MKKNVLEENVKTLTQKNQELESDLSEIKTRYQERTGIDIGELLIEAKINAKKLIDKAKTEANQIRSEISSECGETESRLNDLNERLISVESQFKSVSAEAIGELARVRNELSAVQETFMTRSEQVDAEARALSADNSMMP